MDINLAEIEAKQAEKQRKIQQRINQKKQIQHRQKGNFLQLQQPLLHELNLKLKTLKLQCQQKNIPILAKQSNPSDYNRRNRRINHHNVIQQKYFAVKDIDDLKLKINAIKEIQQKIKDRTNKDLHDEERCCNCYLYTLRFFDDESKDCCLPCVLCLVTCVIFLCIAECCVRCQNTQTLQNFNLFLLKSLYRQYLESLQGLAREIQQNSTQILVKPLN